MAKKPKFVPFKLFISHATFAKRWTQEELAGLTAREMADGAKRILPVWHKITAATVRKFSPTLADRVGLPSSKGIKAVVAGISAAIDAEQLAARRVLPRIREPTRWPRVV
jgi:hypothetical protein